MSECVEGGATIAWRLLATLEGGSLLLAASALLAYTARGRTAKKKVPTCRTVALTNTTRELGKEIKSRLEAHGCVVSVTSEATNQATSAAESEMTTGVASGTASGTGDKFDALVVLGAEPSGEGLDALSGVVMDDVYQNIKLLETLSSQVKQGGCIVWASAGRKSLGAFDSSAAAFDTVLNASLLHIAKVFQCEPIWVGRSSGVQRTADRVLAALVTCDTQHPYSIRNAVNAVGGYFLRWLKTITS